MTNSMKKQLREAWQKRLDEFTFDYFVTLSSNFGDLRYEQMRDRLRQWDAMCNRHLNQKNWAHRPDERLLWFAFFEKLGVNPHWHLLVQIDACVDNPHRAKRNSRFPLMAAKSWRKLMPSGSFDCQAIESSGALCYSAKALGNGDHLEMFVCSREFVVN